MGYLVLSLCLMLFYFLTSFDIFVDTFSFRRKQINDLANSYAGEETYAMGRFPTARTVNIVLILDGHLIHVAHV